MPLLSAKTLQSITISSPGERIRDSVEAEGGGIRERLPIGQVGHNGKYLRIAVAVKAEGILVKIPC